MPGRPLNIEYHLGIIISEYEYNRKDEFNKNIPDEKIEQYFQFMTDDSWPVKILDDDAELSKYYHGKYTPSEAVGGLSDEDFTAILIAARLYFILNFYEDLEGWKKNRYKKQFLDAVTACVRKTENPAGTLSHKKMIHAQHERLALELQAVYAQKAILCAFVSAVVISMIGVHTGIVCHSRSQQALQEPSNCRIKFDRLTQTDLPAGLSFLKTVPVPVYPFLLGAIVFFILGVILSPIYKWDLKNKIAAMKIVLPRHARLNPRYKTVLKDLMVRVIPLELRNELARMYGRSSVEVLHFLDAIPYDPHA